MYTMKHRCKPRQEFAGTLPEPAGPARVFVLEKRENGDWAALCEDCDTRLFVTRRAVEWYEDRDKAKLIERTTL